MFNEFSKSYGLLHINILKFSKSVAWKSTGLEIGFRAAEILKGSRI